MNAIETRNRQLQQEFAIDSYFEGVVTTEQFAPSKFNALVGRGRGDLLNFNQSPDMSKVHLLPKRGSPMLDTPSYVTAFK